MKLYELFVMQQLWVIRSIKLDAVHSGRDCMFKVNLNQSIQSQSISC